jgi:small-conductance mechanosensitive channel
LSTWIAALASIWAGAMFAFQNSIRNLIESIIFLFVTHPFDIGDRIQFKNNFYYVKEMTLMSSTLTHVDGREVYLSNPILSQYFIYNIRRSGNQNETLRIQVDVTTTGDQITKLQNELNAEVKQRFFREFLPNIEIFIEFVKFEKSTIQIKLDLTHRSNFQSGVAKKKRTTMFLTVAKEKLVECGIKAGQMKVVEVPGVSDYYLGKLQPGGSSTSTLEGQGPTAMRPRGTARAATGSTNESFSRML